MARDREYYERIKTQGFEKATVWAMEEMFGRQKQFEEGLREVGRQLDVMANLMNMMMQVAENMKDRTDKLGNILGDNIPDGAPTPGDDKAN